MDVVETSVVVVVNDSIYEVFSARARSVMNDFAEGFRINNTKIEKSQSVFGLNVLGQPTASGRRPLFASWNLNPPSAT